MKKGLIIILFALFAMSNVNAQFSVGVGGTMFSDGTALEGRVDYAINEQLSAVPYFDYFISTKDYGVSDVKASFMMYGLDGHYSFGDPEGLNYYPLLGVNMIAISLSSEDYSFTYSHTGLALGGGLTYALSDSMKLFGEVRYLSHGLASGTGITAGLLFSFN